MSPNERHKRLMHRALLLARKARGDTRHYPMVGAVIVKHGRTVGEGYFRRPGGPHAEVHALAAAGAKARGAELVLNLEPCSHFGRTPPCADAVIAAGVRKVVAGMTDPNPLVAGQGFAKLEAAGIEVVRGVLEDECRELNRVFVKFITTGRPYVILKAALTLDGSIATATGDSKWVTGEAARKEVHKLRDTVQAVMVGAGTVRADNPELTARAGKRRHPRPVVITGRLNIPINARVMETPAEGGPLLFCSKKTDAGLRRAFELAGAEVVGVAEKKGRLDLGEVMAELGARKIASVLIEGGSGLFGEALRAGVVDEVMLFYAPKLLSGVGMGMVSGPGPAKMGEALVLGDVAWRRVGNDFMVTGKICSPD